jgi:hypothetical protein
VTPSDTGLLTEVLIILTPPALALANGLVILDKLYCAYVLHHRETKLCFHAKPKRRSVQNRQWLAVHFVGKHRLRIIGQLNTDRTVEVSGPLCVWLRSGLVIERVENNLSRGWKRTAESEDVMQRYTAPLRHT